jgi:tRNA A37 threonylcarbamoyltransferase TsaD
MFFQFPLVATQTEPAISRQATKQDKTMSANRGIVPSNVSNQILSDFPSIFESVIKSKPLILNNVALQIIYFQMTSIHSSAA